jgi:hypothetical protein
MMREQYRALIDEFLECIARDPIFRRQLREDPLEALESSGFARRIGDLQPGGWEPPEVIGYGCEDTCFNCWTCLSNTCYVTI